MKKSLLVALLFIFQLKAHSAKKVVGATYPTIQSGLNACSEGDTVVTQ